MLNDQKFFSLVNSKHLVSKGYSTGNSPLQLVEGTSCGEALGRWPQDLVLVLLNVWWPETRWPMSESGIATSAYLQVFIYIRENIIWRREKKRRQLNSTRSQQQTGDRSSWQNGWQAISNMSSMEYISQVSDKVLATTAHFGKMYHIFRTIHVKKLKIYVVQTKNKMFLKIVHYDEVSWIVNDGSC